MWNKLHRLIGKKWQNTHALRSLISKESFLSKVSDALSPALLPAVKFAITEEKGELRKSLLLLSVLSLHFFFVFIHFYTYFLNFSKTCP